jgi:hypothetical protein
MEGTMGRVLAVLLALLLSGCDSTVPATRAPEDEAVIRGLEEEERTAVLNGDSVAMQRIWSTEFIVNSPLNQVSPNRGVVLDLVRQGLIHYTAFERRIEELRIIGSIAVVMGAETVQPAGAEGGAVQRRFTHIWQRDAATWRLVARHANNIAVQ